MAPKEKIAVKRQAWNKGLQVGKRDGFTPAQVKRIRGVLRARGAAGVRDLALFSTAIDTMLHGHNLLTLVVGDVQSRNGSIRPLIEVAQSKGAPPVRCALSKSTTMALEKWITAAGLKRADYLFPSGARRVSRPMSGRQLSRLLKVWIVDAGFDPADYSIESLRRTKALHILKGTGDLQTVRALLGHVQIESTARYLGLKNKSRSDSSLPSIRYLTVCARQDQRALSRSGFESKSRLSCDRERASSVPQAAIATSQT
jgi:integrase